MIEKGKLFKLLGTEKALELCSKFPNQRLPGKKFLNRRLRDQFQREFKGKDIAGFAKKYEVSIATLYNWLKRET